MTVEECATLLNRPGSTTTSALHYIRLTLTSELAFKRAVAACPDALDQPRCLDDRVQMQPGQLATPNLSWSISKRDALKGKVLVELLRKCERILVVRQIDEHALLSEFGQLGVASLEVAKKLVPVAASMAIVLAALHAHKTGRQKTG